MGRSGDLREDVADHLHQAGEDADADSARRHRSARPAAQRLRALSGPAGQQRADEADRLPGVRRHRTRAHQTQEPSRDDGSQRRVVRSVHVRGGKASTAQGHPPFQHPSLQFSPPLSTPQSPLPAAAPPCSHPPPPLPPPPPPSSPSPPPTPLLPPSPLSSRLIRPPIVPPPPSPPLSPPTPADLPSPSPPEPPPAPLKPPAHRLNETAPARASRSSTRRPPPAAAVRIQR